MAHALSLPKEYLSYYLLSNNQPVLYTMPTYHSRVFYSAPATQNQKGCQVNTQEIKTSREKGKD